MANQAPITSEEDWSYQHRMAESLIQSVGVEEAVMLCAENGWDDILGVVEARRGQACD